MDQKETKPSPFLRAAGVLLLVLAVAWGLNAWHIHRLEVELMALADEKIVEFQKESSTATPESTRMAAAVVVAKPFIFWGTPAGKVSVFVGRTDTDGGEHIEGFEYFFARNGDTSWSQTESGRCTSDQCTLDGKVLLDALGSQF